MDGPHADTTALITGGAQGLGLAIARHLIQAGCTRLVLTDRNGEQGKDAAQALSVGGVAAHFLHCDMADLPAVQALIGQAEGLVGPVNALVNCAGNTDRGSILDTRPATWDAIFDVNAKGPFFLLQAFANRLIALKLPGGAVNILSIVTHGGAPILAPYGASKSALLYITKNSAHTLAPHRIRVNGINVGWMDTPGEHVTQMAAHGRPANWRDGVEAKLPFGMMLKPDHVAAQVALFLSPQSGVVTGSIMDYDQQVIGIYPDTDKQ